MLEFQSLDLSWPKDIPRRKSASTMRERNSGCRFLSSLQTSAHRSAFVKSEIEKNSTGQSDYHSITTTRSWLSSAGRGARHGQCRIKGREIECSVLGNDNPIASVPGEILPRHEFYSYEAKYLDENGAVLEIPAKLPLEISERIRELAIQTFSVLCCEGMARVDFFLRNGDEIIVNEINTIPGFTRISMYPKLWEASGISYRELIDRLIQLAIERFEREKRLKTDRA